MARFYPDTYLDAVMPGGIAKNGLLYDNLSIKKRYLKALYQAAGREGKALKKTIFETIAYYTKREEKLGTQALLTQRIENFLVWHKVQEEKAAHAGQYYRWLPSDAKNPDPEHQLNYGKVFREGDGHEMPGERYGCRCGIEWLEEKETPQERILQRMNPDFVAKAQRMFDLAEQGLHKQARPLPFQTVSAIEVKKVQRLTGVKLQKGQKHKLVPNGARHTYRNHSRNGIKEIKLGQVAVRGVDWALIPYIVKNYDSLELSEHLSGQGYKVLKYKKIIGKKEYHFREELWKNKSPISKTLFIKKK